MPFFLSCEVFLLNCQSYPRVNVKIRDFTRSYSFQSYQTGPRVSNKWYYQIQTYEV